MRRSAFLLVSLAFLASGCSLLSGTIGPSPSSGAQASPSAGLLTPGPSASQAAVSPGTLDTPSPIDSPTSSEPPVATDTPAATDSPVPRDTPAASPSSQPSGGQGFQPAKFTLSLDKVADGLNDPVFITGDGSGEGRKYILERAGLIKVMLPNGTIRQTPVLDLRGRVATDGERGLLGIAFHPDFAKNGRFFVDYSSADANGISGQTWVVEYQMKDPDKEIAASSGRLVMNFARPDWNHNGGWIGFGPDGYLYIASGDGGGNTPGDPYGNGQDRTDLLGSILRIDVDGKNPYAIPKDNPYAGGQKGFKRELWDYGLRNPWRDSFDSKTGDLWIGDVGQDQIEEIDVQQAGKGGLDFGWSIMEGSICHRTPGCATSGLTLPVTEYSHAKGCAVAGGYVYRGTKQPLLEGGYLFADYCTGTIWGIDAAGAKAGDDLKPRKLLDTGLNWVSFGQDDAGELYLVSFGGGIYHLVTHPNA